MCIKMVYNITTFKNVFQYQMVRFSSAKLQLLLHQPNNHSHPCHHHLLLPSVLSQQSFPSIRVFPSESALCIRWPKYWSFRISPSNEYSGLISFRIDWLDLAVQGTLKSLLQHHSSKASVLQHSGFFMGRLSHPYDCWKNHSFGCTDLCRQNDVSTF